MRCTRCNHPAVPQAVGLTPGGLVVFGWCLACLEETGCRDIKVARSRCRIARTSSRLPGKLDRGAFDPSDEERRRLSAAVAALVTLWSLFLLAAGIWLSVRAPRRAANPFGTGTPRFFLGGGTASAMVALILWAILHGRAIVRSSRLLRVCQVVFFLIAVAILVAGIVRYDPRRNPAVVLAAAAALAGSALARWRETRL